MVCLFGVCWLLVFVVPGWFVVCSLFVFAHSSIRTVFSEAATFEQHKQTSGREMSDVGAGHRSRRSWFDLRNEECCVSFVGPKVWLKEKEREW